MQKNVRVVLDKTGSKWYYIEAACETARNKKHQTEFEKNLKKVLDKKKFVC